MNPTSRAAQSDDAALSAQEAAQRHVFGDKAAMHGDMYAKQMETFLAGVAWQREQDAARIRELEAALHPEALGLVSVRPQELSALRAIKRLVEAELALFGYPRKDGARPAPGSYPETLLRILEGEAANTREGGVT